MTAQRNTAIVTGAASGIGRAMTLGLLGAGIDVAAVDRNEAMARELGRDRADQPLGRDCRPSPPILQPAGGVRRDRRGGARAASAGSTCW